MRIMDGPKWRQTAQETTNVVQLSGTQSTDGGNGLGPYMDENAEGARTIIIGELYGAPAGTSRRKRDGRRIRGCLKCCRTKEESEAWAYTIMIHVLAG